MLISVFRTFRYSTRPRDKREVTWTVVEAPSKAKAIQKVANSNHDGGINFGGYLRHSVELYYAGNGDYTARKATEREVAEWNQRQADKVLAIENATSLMSLANC